MFRKLYTLITIGALVGGGSWAYKQFPQLFTGIFKAAQPGDAAQSANDLPPARPGPTIRIASFNIEIFGEAKFENATVRDILAGIVRKFDVVAIQEIRAKDPTLMSRFVQHVNSQAGARYDFVIGPRLGQTDSKEQYAIIYDITRIEIDKTSAYTVRDPDDALHREPLVAGFRARSAPPNEAFTFTLVDVHTDPDDVADECDALASAFQAVRNDGRGEDDVIMLGDFNTDADNKKFGRLRLLPYITYAIGSQMHTNTLGTKTYDNILFDRRATSEFAGGGYVLDVMKEFKITMDQALLVSDHLPIWAEFSVYEGGGPGAMAANPPPANR